MVATETSLADVSAIDERDEREEQAGPYREVSAIAPFLDHAREGLKASKSHYVALKRFDPNAQTLTTEQVAALISAFKRAKLMYDDWNLNRWLCWAFIAHGIALAGHDGGKKRRFGRQLDEAGVSEARLTRLLDARGDAFFQTLPRVLRLMSSKGVKPNWVELAVLVLNENGAVADETRIRIARDYYTAKASEDRDA
jgi:CRISPR system Cascade subunit CasB